MVLVKYRVLLTYPSLLLVLLVVRRRGAAAEAVDAGHAVGGEVASDGTVAGLSEPLRGTLIWRRVAVLLRIKLTNSNLE